MDGAILSLSKMQREVNKQKPSIILAYDNKEWHMLRSTLCEVSMEILDYRIESKLIAHYSFPGSGDGDVALSEWRMPEWIRLVGKEGQEGGGGKIKAVRIRRYMTPHIT